MYLGRHAEAIDTLSLISNPGNGIKHKTAWEARSHLAECCQALGRTARLDGDSDAAQKHFQEAENWYIAAARIWEPDLDPRSVPCQSEYNRMLQGQMAWLYLDWGDPVKAEALARMFLSGEDALDQNGQHTSYFLLTCSNLGTALLRQRDRNAEAIQVFEQLLAYNSPPLHRIRPLIYLRQLYAWTNNTEGAQKMIQALMDACNQTGDLRFASLLDLTHEQRLALLDFAAMTEYVRCCNLPVEARLQSSLRVPRCD
jgi:tetratricopeptide (TPR) repeat protein